MNRQEEQQATEKMRKLSQEEMMKVDPAEYYGEQERCSWRTLVDEHANIPLPVLETEDDDFIREYIAYWFDMDIEPDGTLVY